jgi:hypothetical protein
VNPNVIMEARNTNEYVECCCTILEDSEYSNTFQQFLLESLPTINVEIFTCAVEVFVL